MLPLLILRLLRRVRLLVLMGLLILLHRLAVLLR